MPSNPLAVGQFVNNEPTEKAANGRIYKLTFAVMYYECELKIDIPIKWRKFIPIANYRGPFIEEGILFLVLVARRDIENEELYSRYIEIAQE